MATEVQPTAALTTVSLEGVPNAVATALNGTSVVWDRLPALIRDVLWNIGDTLVSIAETAVDPSAAEIGELAVQLARCADALEAVT